MKLSHIKEIKNLVESDWREAVENIIAESNDFEAGNYRFIHTDSIDDIMKEELLSDLYMLGCCNAWFIADILDLDLEDIEAIQKAEAFEALGKMLAKQIDEVQESMVSHDGYGHHFNHYDGNEEEIGKYHVFRTN